MTKLAIIANLKAGSTLSAKDLEEKFLQRGQEVTVITFSQHYRQDMKKAIKHGVTTFVAAGGDGTINAIANELASTSFRLGIIPLGTLNHFAKDINIPLGIDDAINCIIKGNVKMIDTARVNRRTFLNNASIGVYPLFVAERERHQSWITKWPAAIIATTLALLKFHHYTLEIIIDRKHFTRRTPFVFVGNNHYTLKQGSRRTSLTKGELSVYIVSATTKLALIRTVFILLLNQRPVHDNLEHFSAKTVTIHHRKHLRVAYDGEIARMTPPLHFSVNHKTLRVITP